jgi:uncharacterized protein YjbJ (UPF0337 family)
MWRRSDAILNSLRDPPLESLCLTSRQGTIGSMTQIHDKSPSNRNVSSTSAQETPNWESVKSSARKAWSKLTDDDFNRSQGSIGKLTDLIHTKFGETKDAISAKLNPTSGNHVDANRSDNKQNSKDTQKK